MPIRVVCHRTGIQPHTLRVWERRYGAVLPARTPSGQRLYSEADVDKLHLLLRATEDGWRIGQVAGHSIEELRELLASPGGEVDSAGSSDPGFDRLLRDCLDAAERLDSRALSAALDRASLVLSRKQFVEELLVRFLRTVGERWSSGELRPAQEHLATAVTRRSVDGFRTQSSPDSAPHLLISTPQGQLHDVGALLAAVTAEEEGWRVTYLGPDLPAEEIAMAARSLEVDAVALSVIASNNDFRRELTRLSELLPGATPLFVGGSGAGAYAELLEALGARMLEDLGEFRQRLRELTYPNASRD
jgi:DNA-binding transcriptional MerR regulator/methylmalonyl-CoA mutase cobalamin-binding subunit